MEILRNKLASDSLDTTTNALSCVTLSRKAYTSPYLWWCPRSESNQHLMITSQLHDLHATGALQTERDYNALSALNTSPNPTITTTILIFLNEQQNANP